MIQALVLGTVVLMPDLLSQKGEVDAHLQEIYPTYGFDSYGIQQGMTQSSAVDIAIDESGFVWIGTQDGLNRFDGYEFTTFRHDPGDPNSISTNSIFKLHNDSKDRLWIGTISGGLSLLEKTTNTMITFRHEDSASESLRSNSIRSMAEDAHGNLWIGTERGLNVVNGETLDIRSLDPIDYRSENQKWITSLYFDDKQTLWIGTLDGLIRYDVEADSGMLIEERPGDSLSISSNLITDIIQDTSGTIWVATRDGLNRRSENGSFTTYFGSLLSDDTPAESYIEVLFLDAHGNLWVGFEDLGVKVMSYNGFFVPLDERMTGSENGDGSYRVKAINEDKDGNIWIGLWAKGVLRLNAKKPPFTMHRSDPGDTNSIRFNHVSGIYEDVDGLVWIATYGGGVSIWERSSNEYTNYLYSPGDAHSLDGNRIFSFAEDLDNNLWVAGERVLQIYNKKGGEFTNVLDPDVLTFNIFWPIAVDKSGDIWVGTIGDGLLRFARDRELLHQYKYDLSDSNSISSDEIQDILHEDLENIWLATSNGLNHLNPKTSEVTRYFNDPDDSQSLSHNRLSVLLKDKSGTLWVASLFGLNKLIDKEKGTFVRYGLADGLPNDVIYCILEDDEGYMWISTNRGMSRFDPDKEVFTNFDISDGLQDYEFNRCSCHDGKRSGEMYFGGIGGFNTFDPSSISASSKMPPLVFTSFTQQGSSEENQSVSIDYFVANKAALKLPYDQNILTFEIAALDYQKPAKINYKYRLKGAFNNKWFELGTRRDITFSALSPGEYLLQAVNTNSTGEWNKIPAQIAIIITPPWYRSGLAYVGYLLFSVIGLYLLFAFQKRRLWLKTQLAFREKEAMHLKDLDEQKNNLYSNITHEFRTPLTIILGLADQLAAHPKQHWSRHLNAIKRNGNQLLHLVNQMLELTRIQSGHTRPVYVQSDVMAFANYLVESYQSYALINNKNLTLYSEPDSFMMDYDPEKLQRIIGNLIANALKYTPEYGRIQAIFKGSDEGLDIEISDSGVGIASADLPHIFDRFYQSDQDTADGGFETGTGIGLSLVKELIELMSGSIEVKSEVGLGTSFSIHLPLRRIAEIEEIDVAALPEPRILPGIGADDLSQNDDPTHILRSGDNRYPSLMIIEDNRDVIEYLKTCLDQHYTITTARNGREGLEKALEMIPDIIITDVMMPEMDGYLVCKRLKEDNRTSHIPIILLTAKASSDDRLKGLSEGADAYLSKPFNKKELLIRLEKLVEGRKKLQDSFKAGAVKQKVENEFLQRLDATIFDYIDDDLFDVTRLCRAMTMSRTQLHRKIKALTTMSAAQYMRYIRLNEAKRLLQTTDSNISQVAYQVGFKHPNNFSTAYKSHFGHLPNETRK